VVRRPNPSLAGAKAGQAVVYRAGLVAVGVAVDPGLERIAVLRAGDAHGDEGGKLGQHVFIELGGPLGNRNQPKSEGSPAPCYTVNLTEYAGQFTHRLLRRKGVGFFQHKPKRLAVMREQVVQEIGDKASLIRLAHLAHVKKGGHAG